MSREELLKRLEALNGGPLQEAIEPVTEEKPRRRKGGRKAASKPAYDTTPAPEPAAPAPAMLQSVPNTRPNPFAAPAGAAVHPSPSLQHVREDEGAGYVLSGRYPGRPRGKKVAARPGAAAPLDSKPFVSLDTAAPGWEQTSPAGSAYWLVERRLHEIADWCPPVVERAIASLAAATGHWVGFQLGLPRLWQLQDFLFVDLETTGLNSEPLFLIGTLQFDTEGLVARQYLSRTYEEEQGVISAFAGTTSSYEAMVTFNGISFDGPYLQRRARAAGIDLRCPQRHLDLLLPARRRYRGSLPNCKLQTLEYYLCGRERSGDIPGSEIPAAYHDFATTGNAAQIGSILQHNLLDLLTLVDLLDRVGDE